MEERIPRPGEFYRHFKNKLYQIVAVAEHTETGEALVIYQALYGDFKIYARPFSMFVSEVDRDKYPRVTQKYRFERVSSPEAPKDVRPVRYIGRDTEVSENQGRRIIGRTEEKRLRGAEKAPGQGNGTRQTVWTIPRSAQGAFGEQEKEKQSRLSTWKAGETEAARTVTDSEDYEEAALLSGEDSVVIPREGRAEKAEDELWESLTDEAVRAAKEQEGTEKEEEGEWESVNPKFLDFLEARSYESKAVILESMKEDLDDEMIDGLAMAVDVEIPKGPVEERYHRLEQCLQTMARFEDERLR